jgi:hypothetical protein
MVACMAQQTSVKKLSRLLKWIVVLALVILIPWLGLQLLIRRHHLSFVPDAMGVWNLLYVSEESWGFGPGGNETGVIVYEMPRAVAEALQSQGLEYLQKLPRKSRSSGNRYRGLYSNWHPTPVELDNR